MLGGIPGLNAQQELAWARASRKAKDYIDKAEEAGKDLVKRTPDGSMNNLLSGFNSLAGGVSAVGGLEGLAICLVAGAAVFLRAVLTSRMHLAQVRVMEPDRVASRWTSILG